ncbi:MAG TPA: 3'-5' exonuclease [Vitreimonas sp.]|nr:3'-5' exonuclease [Vitreimonas sp.]
MKILYFDVETTGRDAVKNDITQLSGALEIDGNIVEEFNYRLQPINWDTVEPEALEVTGISLEELKTFPTPDKAYKSFLAMLDKHISKFDRTDKFYPAGYNVRFDLDFLGNFFKKNGNNYFGSYCNWKAIDPLPILQFMDAHKMIALENYKLSTVCNHFGIEIQAHDAMSDIMATKKLIAKVRGFISTSEIL